MPSRIAICLTGLCALALTIAAATPAASQPAPRPDRDSIAAVMDRLLIELPASIAERDPVRGPLEELGREPCDQKAIGELGQALDKVGRRREAANAYTSFSATCGHHAPSLRAAVNVLLTLSDYQRAIGVATDLIALEPFNDNGYFLRAVAHDRAGETQHAIDDYVTAIELFGNKKVISSVSYLALARDYEKLGRFCDAIEPIETWVDLNPAANDTSQTRAIIAEYTSKGRCQSAAGNEERFPRSGNLVRLQVSVNGVRGNFVLDTGATFVALTQSFAQKAMVEIEPDSVVRLHTANGMAEGKRGSAKTIQLRSLSAKDVQVVVQTDAKAAFGDGIDGLLGMSFLARFKLSMDAQAVRISGRKGK
jgi:clan AA aspartic protease (TIGR02281 family)